jgi:Bacterial SH3 domain
MTKSIFLKRFSATVQFILGFLLGIGAIAGISGAIIFAYYAKMSVLPKKPVFPEVTPPPETASAPTEDSIEPLESTTSTPEEESANSVEDSELDLAEELPPNAYRAVVTWPEGLSLRAEPESDAERIGGVENKATIIILEDSPDGKWQKVRLPGNDQVGWIKGGNTEKLPE